MVKYTIEDTDEGFKLTADTGGSSVSFASAGNHQDLEALYLNAHRTFEKVRGNWVAEKLSRVRS